MFEKASSSPGETRPRPKLGIVTPLANEEETIETFMTGVLGQLRPQDRLYCVFDNVCKDSSRSKAEAAAAADPRVRVVWAPENRCVVDAYFRGYRKALADGCGWVLEMDGGLSHRPDQIPRFLAAMDAGNDYAAGSRFIPGGSFDGPLSRRFVSKGGTFLTNTLLGTTMRDMTSGYECFTREALSYVVSRGVRSRAHFFQTEIRVMLRDWKSVEVPIDYGCPSKSVGKASLGEAFRILWSLRKAPRLPKPRRDSDGAPTPTAPLPGGDYAVA